MIARLAIAAFAIGLCVYYQGGIAVTSDGIQYLAPPPRHSPFRLRWLLPWVLGRRPWLWAAVAWVCLLVTALLFPGDLWVCALWCGLPWVRTMAMAPVLMDAPAMALSLACRRWPHALWGLGAMVSERMPVFAGIMAWRWEPVALGLACTLAAVLWTPGRGKWSNGPLQAGWSAAERRADIRAMLLPWGAGMAALLSGGWTLPELALIAVAYGQLLVATDSSRLYQWAAPVVLPRAMAMIPARWRLAAVVLHWLNPWAWAPRKQVMC